MTELGVKEIPVQLTGGLYRVPVCSKRVWERLRRCETEKDYVEICGTLLKGVPFSEDVPDCEKRLLAMVYEESIERLCETAGLTIPYYPAEPEDDDIKYYIYTQFDKLAADYANMSIYEIDDIPITDYRLLVRDAFISKLAQTEKGRKYLKNAYRLTQTEADEDISI